MSFNPDPRWTQDIILPSKYEIRCPECGQVAVNAETIMEPLNGATYYEARHIPPALIATCGNVECNICDEDFAVDLKVIVLVRDMPADEPWCHWIIKGPHSDAMIVCQGLESVFRAAMRVGLPLDDYQSIQRATAEEISRYKHSGCEPLIYGGSDGLHHMPNL